MKSLKKMSYLLIGLFCVLALTSCKSSYDYAQVNSPEESGMVFTRITPEKATVLCNNTFAGNYLALDDSINKLLYLSKVDNDVNLYLLDLNSPSVSQQRTYRNNVNGGFGISPDGEEIVFTAGGEILTTNAYSGSICKQITSSNRDYAPTFSVDGKKIFFHRMQSPTSSESNIWSYDVDTKEMSMYGSGYCPVPSIDNNVYILKEAKKGKKNFVEIRRVNYATGANDVILSNENYRPRSVSISPDGKWLLFSASHLEKKGWKTPQIYIMRTNGTELTQITYHEGGNYSPIWSTGSTIYFISGRGSKDKAFGIWKTTFNVR